MQLKHLPKLVMFRKSSIQDQLCFVFCYDAQRTEMMQGRFMRFQTYSSLRCLWMHHWRCVRGGMSKGFIKRPALERLKVHNEQTLKHIIGCVGNNVVTVYGQICKYCTWVTLTLPLLLLRLYRYWLWVWETRLSRACAEDGTAHCEWMHSASGGSSYRQSEEVNVLDV